MRFTQMDRIIYGTEEQTNEGGINQMTETMFHDKLDLNSDHHQIFLFSL